MMAMKPHLRLRYAIHRGVMCWHIQRLTPAQTPINNLNSRAEILFGFHTSAAAIEAARVFWWPERKCEK
jgi:hypothetical protein